MVGRKGRTSCRASSAAVLMQYDDLAGAATNNIEARIAGAARRTASTRSWPSRTPCWRCFTSPTRSCASGCFRIYNEYMAELQERVERPLLRRRADQLVGRRRAPGAR